MITPEVGAQLHATDPRAGTWTLIIDFYNSVSGTATAQPFTVTVNDTPVKASAKGLPDGQSLTAGATKTAYVRVTNNGTTPEAYFVDPRLNSQVTLNLAAQSASSLTLPNVDGGGTAVPRSLAHDGGQGDGVVVGPDLLRHHLPLR